MATNLTEMAKVAREVEQVCARGPRRTTAPMRSESLAVLPLILLPNRAALGVTAVRFKTFRR